LNQKSPITDPSIFGMPGAVQPKSNLLNPGLSDFVLCNFNCKAMLDGTLHFLHMNNLYNKVTRLGIGKNSVRQKSQEFDSDREKFGKNSASTKI